MGEPSHLNNTLIHMIVERGIWMTITVNGKSENLEKKMSILDLLTLKGLDPNTVVVEYNADIVKKEEWGNIILKENDTLEVLRFVGGG
jgi:sulfur carrier protein